MVFKSYIQYSEEETLAAVLASLDMVPVNISLDEGSDMNLETGDECVAELWSNDYEVSIYSNEEEYRDAGTSMAPISMIPMGTFPANPRQKDFRQNAMILFTGIVREAERNPEPEEDAPVWRLRIETYALSFDLYYFEDALVQPGYLVHGQVWLYGAVRRKTATDSQAAD